MIATATAIHPGFGGTITLEMVNLGEVPLIIYPGLRVAQVVFTKCDGGTEYDGDYCGQTEPNFQTMEGNPKENLGFWVPNADVDVPES